MSVGQNKPPSIGVYYSHSIGTGYKRKVMGSIISFFTKRNESTVEIPLIPHSLGSPGSPHQMPILHEWVSIL